MNNLQTNLLKILSNAIRDQSIDDLSLSTNEWVEIFEEAKEHQIHNLIFQTVSNLDSFKVNKTLKDSLKKSIIFSAISVKSRLMIMPQILSALQQANIPIMILKGLYIRGLYPLPELRSMGDVDLFTKKQYIEEARIVFEHFGYKVEPNHDTKKHIAFVHERYISIELHFALANESVIKEGTDINNKIWDECIQYEFGSYIPSETMHVIYCCIHMLNHLKKSGFGLRQLSDFVLLIEKQSIDWDELISLSKHYGISNFFSALLYISNKYLSLNIPHSILETSLNIDCNYYDLLLNEIFSSGVFGGKSIDRLTNNSLSRYLKKNTNNTVSFNIRYLFPPIDKMKDAYNYAKKFPVLIPIAWIHRIVYNAFRKDIQLSKKLPDKIRINKFLDLINWIEKQ